MAALPPGCRAPTIPNSIPCTGPPALPRLDFVGDYAPGDDLYTACVLAIDPNTGKLKWHFQFTPHDLYDYDANETTVLVDTEENGSRRHLLVQANRNGFFYVLDRTDGKFLRATPFVEKLNWAKSASDSAWSPRLIGSDPPRWKRRTSISSKPF